MIEKDVVIIGSGISGLYISKLLEKKGIDFITLEGNRSVGKYGNRIINNSVFKKLELDNTVILRDIKKINFFSPSEIKISTSSEKSRGYVVNLRSLEMDLFESLVNSDNIKFNQFVQKFDLKEGVIKTKDYDIKSKIIIFSSGILQDFIIYKLLLEKPQIVFCYTNEVEGHDEIATILDNNYAFGFYGWVMPLSGEVMEVGFGTSRLHELKGKDFNKILFSLPYIHRYRKNRKKRQMGGFIPISVINKKYGNNWILIGDAAGGEPLMGGSIHKSIDEALIASKVIELFLNGKISNLDMYDKLWKNNFEKDINEQEKIRNLIDKSSNYEMNRAFEKVKESQVKGEGLINDLFKNIIKNLENNKKNG